MKTPVTVLQQTHVTKARQRLKDRPPTDGNGKALPVEGIDWTRDPVVQDLQHQIDEAEQAHKDLTAELVATEKALAAEQDSLKHSEVLYLLKRITEADYHQHQQRITDLEQQAKLLRARLYAWEEQLKALPVALQEASRTAQAQAKLIANALVMRLAGELYEVIQAQVAPLSRHLHDIHFLMTSTLPQRPLGPARVQDAGLYPVKSWVSEHGQSYALPGLGEYDPSAFIRAWLERLKTLLGLTPARHGRTPNPAPPAEQEPTLRALMAKYRGQPQVIAGVVQTYNDLRTHKPDAIEPYLSSVRWELLRGEQLDPIPHYTR